MVRFKIANTIKPLPPFKICQLPFFRTFQLFIHCLKCCLIASVYCQTMQATARGVTLYCTIKINRPRTAHSPTPHLYSAQCCVYINECHPSQVVRSVSFLKFPLHPNKIKPKHVIRIPTPWRHLADLPSQTQPTVLALTNAFLRYCPEFPLHLCALQRHLAVLKPNSSCWAFVVFPNVGGENGLGRGRGLSPDFKMTSHSIFQFVLFVGKFR